MALYRIVMPRFDRRLMERDDVLVLAQEFAREFRAGPNQDVPDPEERQGVIYVGQEEFAREIQPVSVESFIELSMREILQDIAKPLHECTRFTHVYLAEWRNRENNDGMSLDDEFDVGVIPDDNLRFSPVRHVFTEVDLFTPKEAAKYHDCPIDRVYGILHNKEWRHRTFPRAQKVGDGPQSPWMLRTEEVLRWDPRR